jgi:hypothetical protein
MPHAPTDPRVLEAYGELIDQTTAQYQALVDAGYQFYFIDPENDLYEGNPWNAMRDLRANQRMAVFPTEAGFGSGDTELNVADNPLLADTGIEWSFGSADGQKKRVLANDLFRAVHDAFGHGMEGAGFRARGEENAWQAHVRLFTGNAVAAITTETRGQNSWLNYGPHGEANQTAKVEDTIFADQKTGLLPEWAWLEGRANDENPTLDERGMRYMSDRPQLPIRADGKVELTHWSNGRRKTIEPAKAGSGPLTGPDYRSGAEMSFYGIDPGGPNGYRKESGLGPWRHTVAVDPATLYPWFEDPDGMKARFLEKEGMRASVSDYQAMIEEAGYLGYYVTNDGEGSAVHGLAAAVFKPLKAERAVDERKVGALQPPADQGKTYNQTLFTPPGPEMTETDAFKKWFGKSEVTNPDGTPRVVYHGTGKGGFTVFDTDGKGKTSGTGAFFADTKENARTYSGTYKDVEFPDVNKVLADPKSFGFDVYVDGDETTITDPDGYEYDVPEGKTADDVTAMVVKEWFLSGGPGANDPQPGNYSVYLKMENPMIYDAEGANWDRIGGETVYQVWDENGDTVEYFYDEQEAKDFIEFNPNADENYTINVERIEGDQTTDDIVREAKEYGDYDGVIFENVEDSGIYGRGGAYAGTVYVVFKPNQIKAVQNLGTFNPKNDNILMQTNRGSIQFPAGGVANGQTVINTFKGADLSTVLHESGHLFLTILQAEAARGDSSAVAEMDTIKAWWLSNAGDVAKDATKATGVAVSAEDVSRAITFGSSGDFQIDTAIDVGMQEQFARGFEAYLMEGKAPSEELRSVFASFREWLKSIYQSLASLNVKVSPEMSAVFDRMLATDEEIAKASQRESERSVLFTSAEMIGMSADDYEKYQALAVQAQDEAKAKLTAEVMAPIRRAKEKWYRDEKAKLVETLTAAKKALPIYRAIQEMRFGKTFEGEETPGIKLNRKAIEDTYGSEMLPRLPGAPKTGRGHR